jgi:hypothetical protein
MWAFILSGNQIFHSWGAMTMKHTIVVKRGGVLHKIAKGVFGTDGSYCVTAPYHNANKAVLFKATVDYSIMKGPRHLNDMSFKISKTDFLDLGSADTERVKLSYHPDGFVQFSGPGVVSGRHSDGSPKGIGIVSTPLGYKIEGPVFSIVLTSLDDFTAIPAAPGDMFLLDADAIYAIPGCSALVIEAHYFPPMWYRFIRRSKSGTQDVILLRHPSTAVVELKVLRIPDQCTIQGSLGFELYSLPVSDAEIASGKLEYPHFMLNGPGSILRTDANGHHVADVIACMYPKGELDAPWLGRSLNFLMQFGTYITTGEEDANRPGRTLNVPKPE